MLNSTLPFATPKPYKFLQPLTDSITKFLTVDLPVTGMSNVFNDDFTIMSNKNHFIGSYAGQYIKDFTKINLSNITTPIGNYNCTYIGNAIGGSVKNIIKGKPFYTAAVSSLISDTAKDHGYAPEYISYVVKPVEKIIEYAPILNAIKNIIKGGQAYEAIRDINPSKAAIEGAKGFMIAVAVVSAKNEIYNKYASFIKPCIDYVFSYAGETIKNAFENTHAMIEKYLIPDEYVFNPSKQDSTCVNCITDNYNDTDYIHFESNVLPGDILYYNTEYLSLIY
jgi:hypothetical protein